MASLGTESLNFISSLHLYKFLFKGKYVHCTFLILNRFSEIPDCVYKLPSLEILIARDNRLTSVNVSGLSQLRGLATLDLANNDINHIPPELGNMTQLR